jgi:peptidoglycan/LPS O-acetylase OafA/YrhL
MRSRSNVEEKVQPAGVSDRPETRGWRRRWSRRNVAAATLLVYASTFLWMTSAFAGTKKPPGGATWAVANIGALASLALFALAAWGVFRSRPWWERAASAGAIVGLAALVPYGLAASTTGVSGPGLNSAIHIIGCAAVLLVLLVPALEHRMTAWLSGHGRVSGAVARGLSASVPVNS